uniref:hypothetical protein n=1 Tax=Agathobacter sp. TaxID=2021311 RepID=UPI004057BCFD
MEKETMKNLVDNAVETMNDNNEIIANRVAEKIGAKSEAMKEDKDVAVKTGKNAIKHITEITKAVYEAASDHYADLLSGKGLDIKRDKANAMQIIDKIIDAADEYYEVISDHIVGKMEDVDKDIEMDEAAIKQIVDKVIDSADMQYGTISDEIAKNM